MSASATPPDRSSPRAPIRSAASAPGAPIIMTTTTTDRAEINRRNAQSSTGPKTPEGKERSKFNALKHGLTAKTLVLPGEDPEVYLGRIESFRTILGPRNDLEQYLAEQVA